jgi:hypothetical protein
MASRIEFSESVKAEIAKAAMHFCSKRDCLRFTGYADENGKARSVAEAAHLIPAGKKGPRFKAGAEEAYIRSAKNGIWLCRVCHDTIDTNPGTFPEALIQTWKEEHEALIKSVAGKDLELVVFALRNDRRYHQEAIDVLSFLDDRRVLFTSMDNENAEYAFESTKLIRQKIVETRSKINPNTPLWDLLKKVDLATQEFLKSLGPKVDLTKLYCGCGPEWEVFTKAVNQYRAKTKIYLQTLAGECGYKMMNL